MLLFLSHFSIFRAINFAAYGNGKKFFAQLNHGNETVIVHLAAAANSGKMH
jgi:solute carrier family 25 protein 33/36